MADIDVWKTAYISALDKAMKAQQQMGIALNCWGEACLHHNAVLQELQQRGAGDSYPMMACGWVRSHLFLDEDFAHLLGQHVEDGPCARPSRAEH